MATERPAGTKNIVLRLDQGLAERLQTVADVEGRSVSDVLREAVARLVDQRRGDERFIRLLEENMARHQRLLEGLRDQERGSGTRWPWPAWSWWPAAPSASERRRCSGWPTWRRRRPSWPRPRTPPAGPRRAAR